MFADWLWALTFRSDYLHTTSALSNVIIASQNKVVHCNDFLCQLTGMLSTSTLNDSVSVDNTKALVFFSKNLSDGETYANDPDICEVNSIESFCGCVHADDQGFCYDWTLVPAKAMIITAILAIGMVSTLPRFKSSTSTCSTRRTCVIVE